MIDPNIKVQRTERATSRRLENGSSVLLHLDTALYFGLNEVGAAIWDLADGRTVAEVVEGLRAQLDDPPEDLIVDVVEFLEALEERLLVTLVQPD
jgi:hypothetical protein